MTKKKWYKIVSKKTGHIWRRKLSLSEAKGMGTRTMWARKLHLKLVKL